ncbi:MAG: hypothetical protein H6822_09045 [Planctomycetaceae bacterium]|nr:hypothetical protein [Planctomycetales bacterium]MCB9922221.1 hypothetical protein [Planctomycetaceae bacterium]MCB9922316.1 hypothetical protein [Planctomycetaceae bacterium]
MSVTLDEPAVRPSTSPAQRIRAEMAAVRLSVSWFGVRKALTDQQRKRAAVAFDAQSHCLSAGKRLLDTKHPAYKGLTAIRGRAIGYWRGVTVPFPEPGMRLIRQGTIETFDLQMAEFRAELNEAVQVLETRYDDLKDLAQQQLGSLFNAADYPLHLQGLFVIEWDYPAVEAPSYLRQLNPALYEQECARVASRFDEAVRLTEAAFIDEFTKLVDHLTERLSGDNDGQPKVFRDSAVGNLVQFFDRFRNLNIRSNDQLDELVEQVQDIVQGRSPQQLRDNGTLRQSVAAQLTEVQNALDDLLVDRPRRNILRRPRIGE